MKASGFFSLPRPRVMAHRGASGTHPENTLAAFDAACRAGIPYSELDVHMTRDGEVVVCHDDDLARTTDRAGLIGEMALSELRWADAGYRFSADGGATFPFRGRGLTIPTLAEVLGGCPSVRVVVEVKQRAPSLIGTMLGVIDTLGARERVLVASEHPEPLSEIRALAPGIPTNFSAPEVRAFFAALTHQDARYRPPAPALQIPPFHEATTLVTAQSVEFAHSMDVEVHVWTVNEASEMSRILGLGVDGIITDFPERCLALI